MEHVNLKIRKLLEADEAYQQLKRAVQSDPHDITAWERLSVAAKRTGKEAEIIQMLRADLQTDPQAKLRSLQLMANGAINLRSDEGDALRLEVMTSCTTFRVKLQEFAHKVIEETNRFCSQWAPEAFTTRFSHGLRYSFHPRVNQSSTHTIHSSMMHMHTVYRSMCSFYAGDYHVTLAPDRTTPYRDFDETMYRGCLEIRRMVQEHLDKVIPIDWWHIQSVSGGSAQVPRASVVPEAEIGPKFIAKVLEMP